VYGTAVFGGWIADTWLGQRKSVILGGLIMAAAQFMLAAPVDIMGTSGAFSLSALGIYFPETPTSFYLGLLLMCVGNGFFKPNISTMVGELYPRGDARRDGAFVIFYMGINLAPSWPRSSARHSARIRPTAGASASSLRASACCSR
jgi:POT family proton-dependent oligopeptide transporter